MIRATTPTHIFTFPEVLQVSGLEKALITYKQCDHIVVEKTLDDATVDVSENQLAVTFTQQEMNRFKPGVALIQVRVKRQGKVLASQTMKIKVNQVLNQEVL